MKTKYKFGTIFLIFFLFGSILGYTLAQSGNTFIISEGKYPQATYTIWFEGSTYYSKNDMGAIDYSGTNFTKVIQDSIDSFGTVWGSITAGSIKITAGSYSSLASIIVRQNTKIYGEGFGNTHIIATGNFSMFLLEGTNTQCTYFNEIYDLNLVGNGKDHVDADGISVKFGERNKFEGLSIEAMNDAFFFNGTIQTFLTNIHIWGTGTQQNEIGIRTSWNPSMTQNINEIFVNNLLIGDTASSGIRLHGASGSIFNNVQVVNAGNSSFPALYVGDESVGEYSEFLHFINVLVDSPAFNPNSGWYFVKGSAERMRGVVISNSWVGGYQHGLYTNGVTDFSISNFYVQDILQNGIVLTAGTERVSINGGLITQWDRSDTATYHGIEITNSGNITISNIMFENTNTGNASIRETGTTNHNIIFGINSQKAEPIYTVGANSSVTISWNATVWIP